MASPTRVLKSRRGHKRDKRVKGRNKSARSANRKETTLKVIARLKAKLKTSK